jgi:hypothetical protein
MNVQKGRLHGSPRTMLRVRLRIKQIKRSSNIGRGLVDRVRHVEPVDTMVQRLRLGHS